MVSRGTWGVAEAPGGDGLVFSAALWPKPHIFVCWPVTIGDGSRPSTRPHPKIMVFVFEYRVSGNLRDTGYRFISSRHLVPSKPGQKSLKSSSRSTITSQTVVTTSKYCYGTVYTVYCISLCTLYILYTLYPGPGHHSIKRYFLFGFHKSPGKLDLKNSMSVLSFTVMYCH